MQASQQVLEEGLQELRLALEPDTRVALLRLAELLAQWAERINLTGHRSSESIVRRLILDALAMDAVLPAWQQLADLGSGAGFPGLPLALAHPERQVVLVDARERRHHFQRFALRSLAISNARARRGRVEALEPDPSDLVVAQALAAPDRALGLALPWARAGGWIALPGAERAPSPRTDERIATIRVARYRVPCGGPLRTLWLGQRAPSVPGPSRSAS